MVSESIDEPGNMTHQPRREVWICGHSKHDDDSAFTQAELDRITQAPPFGSFSPMSIGANLDMYIDNCDWDGIEVILMRLLATPLKPGDLSRIQDADLGTAVFWLEQRKVTNNNSLGVRLAVVLVSLWSSHIKHLEAVRNKQIRQ